MERIGQVSLLLVLDHLTSVGHRRINADEVARGKFRIEVLVYVV